MGSDDELLRLEALSEEQLTAFVANLLEKDFNRLVQLLYRFDVSEEKIRNAVANAAPQDVSTQIARIFLERLAQTRELRAQFPTRDDIPEDERW